MRTMTKILAGGAGIAALAAASPAPAQYYGQSYGYVRMRRRWRRRGAAPPCRTASASAED